MVRLAPMIGRSTGLRRTSVTTICSDLTNLGFDEFDSRGNGVSQLVFCMAHQVPGYSDQASHLHDRPTSTGRDETAHSTGPPTRLGHETRRKKKMRTLLALLLGSATRQDARRRCALHWPSYSARPRGKTQDEERTRNPVGKDRTWHYADHCLTRVISPDP